MDNINSGHPSLPSEHIDADQPSAIPLDLEDGQASTWFSRTVPPDVMRLIDSYIPMESITNLALADQAMWQAHTTPDARLPYFACIRAIHAAAKTPCDTTKVVDALRAIDQEPLMAKPQLMRALAEKVPGLAQIGKATILTEWTELVTQVETALREAFGPDWRGPQLKDLRIATLHAQNVPFLRRELASPLSVALRQCIDDFPQSMAADFMETAVALEIEHSMSSYWEAFLENVTTLSRPASDNFARAIGVNLSQFDHIAQPLAFLRKLGITETQISDVIIPSCAAAIFGKFMHTPMPIDAACARWDGFAERLHTSVEDTFYPSHIVELRSNTDLLSLPRFLSLGADPKRLHDNHIAAIKKLESDTISALGDDQVSIDAFVSHWILAGTKVDTVEEWMEKFDVLTSPTLPLVCQPALLDRWALGIHPGPDLATDISAHEEAIHALLHANMTLPVFSAQPKLLGRLSVALIHAMDVPSAIKSNETVDAIKQIVTDLFDQVPPHGWTAMLELGIGPDGHLASRDRIRRFAEFVVDPLASAALPTKSFCFYVSLAAARVWDEIRDAPSENLAKFDVFCDRFALPEADRPFAKKSILNGIVDRAVAGKYTLSEGLALGGFDADLDAIRHADKMLQLHIGSNQLSNKPT